jgi:hypothetical protein
VGLVAVLALGTGSGPSPDPPGEAATTVGSDGAARPEPPTEHTGPTPGAGTLPTAPPGTTSTDAAPADPEDGVPADDEVAASERTPPLAHLGDLELWSPSAEPLVVGYHEATHVSAEPVVPLGRLTDDHNTTRTDLPSDDPAGVPYVVQASRGRAAGPTSAIDVVVTEGTTVLAPVTGTVADVRSYVLYGSHQDLRVEIVPDSRPDLRLVVIHLDGVEVAAGDRVVGGVTPIAATARAFPFSSHIDRETEPDRHPHVHLELQPVDRPRPGDDPDDDEVEDDEGEDGEDVQAGP